MEEDATFPVNADVCDIVADMAEGMATRLKEQQTGVAMKPQAAISVLWLTLAPYNLYEA